MKRILFIVGLILAVVCLYGYLSATQNPATVEPINLGATANNPHSAQVWGYSAPGYKIPAITCTTSAIMGSDYTDWTMWLRRSKDGDCDSCGAIIYFDGSLDGSNWIAIENQRLAGKVTDTLGAVTYWSTKKISQVAGDTLLYWGTVKSFFEKGCYFKYYRFRLMSGGATACSTYFWPYKILGRK